MGTRTVTETCRGVRARHGPGERILDAPHSTCPFLSQKRATSPPTCPSLLPLSSHQRQSRPGNPLHTQGDRPRGSPELMCLDPVGLGCGKGCKSGALGKSFLLSAPQCPSPGVSVRVRPQNAKASKWVQMRGGMLAGAAPGSLTQAPPGLGPSALGRGPHARSCQEPALHLDVPWNYSRLIWKAKGVSGQHMGLDLAP